MGWDDSSDEENEPEVVFNKKKPATSWEDDDESSEDEAPKVVAPKPKNENKKVVSKARSKKDVIRGGNASAAADEPALDPVEEKLRRQKMVEDGDLAVTMDLFGAAPEDDTPGSITNPKTKIEFEAFAEILGKKLKEHSASAHYQHCVKEMLRHALEGCDSQTIKGVGTFCNTKSAEVAKAEKAEAQKGKKQNKKKQLQTSKADDFMDAGLGHGGDYDAVGFDDGDFM